MESSVLLLKGEIYETQSNKELANSCYQVKLLNKNLIKLIIITVCIVYMGILSGPYTERSIWEQVHIGNE